MRTPEKQKREIWSAVIALLQIMSWASATSRTFAPYDDASSQGKSPNSLQAVLHSEQGLKSMEGVAEIEKETYNGMSTLGSRPPSCERKCGGCIPCEAKQVPTTNDHLGVQYANYEPEGWKCKCGASFYNP